MFSRDVKYLPHVKSIESSDGRYYCSPSTGLWYPSVTTVVNDSKKEFFAEWRAKSPENEQKMIFAANRGNMLHSIVEGYLRNSEHYKKDQLPLTLDMFQTIKPAVDKINNIQLQETCLWSDFLKIAGRVDCIAEYEGVMSAIDFKGSGEPKKEEWILNYFEQASCYSVMYEEQFGIPINQLVLIVACQDGTLQVFVKPTKDYLRSLKNTIKTYWESHSLDKIQIFAQTQIQTK